MEMPLQPRQDSQSGNAEGGRKWLKLGKCCPPPIQTAERGQNQLFLLYSARRSETGSPVCLPAGVTRRWFPPGTAHILGCTALPVLSCGKHVRLCAASFRDGAARILQASQRGFPDEWALPGPLPAREGFGRVLQYIWGRGDRKVIATPGFYPKYISGVASTVTSSKGKVHCSPPCTDEKQGCGPSPIL